MEDYTSRYKGEAVEIALFGGEYQDGILTAYCLIEDVAHGLFSAGAHNPPI